MKLYDLIEKSGDEITVWDKDYDIETYFYGINYNTTHDDWDNSIYELAKMLDVVEYNNNGVTVNLSELIERNLPELDKTDLFIYCDIDSIMDDIEAILSGNVSDKWLHDFVDVLKQGELSRHADNKQNQMISDRDVLPVAQGNIKPRLFVDMDGTIARFHDEVNYLERMYEPDFFKGLKPFEQFIKAIKELPTNVEVFIISACIDSSDCQKQKNIWLDKYLSQIDEKHRIFVPIGANKALYIPKGINANDILIDDYNKNLEEWGVAGGKAIKCKNNINDKGLYGEPWAGAKIDNALVTVDSLMSTVQSLLTEENTMNNNENVFIFEIEQHGFTNVYRNDSMTFDRLMQQYSHVRHPFIELGTSVNQRLDSADAAYMAQSCDKCTYITINVDNNEVEISKYDNVADTYSRDTFALDETVRKHNRICPVENAGYEILQYDEFCDIDNTVLGVCLAKSKTTDMYVTWDYSYFPKDAHFGGLNHGHYSQDYITTQADYHIRCSDKLSRLEEAYKSPYYKVVSLKELEILQESGLKFYSKPMDNSNDFVIQIPYNMKNQLEDVLITSGLKR